jgi:hypothetical protein
MGSWLTLDLIAGTSVAALLIPIGSARLRDLRSLDDPRRRVPRTAARTRIIPSRGCTVSREAAILVGGECCRHIEKGIVR